MFPKSSNLRQETCCRTFATGAIPLPILLLRRYNLFNKSLLDITDANNLPASSFSWLVCKSSICNKDVLLSATRIASAQLPRLLPCISKVFKLLFDSIANASSVLTSFGN